MNIRDKAVPESTPLFAELTEKEKELAELKATIAAAIASRRIELGMNQKQFAKHLGISQGMVSRMESGEYNYSIEKLHELCYDLGLDFTPVITRKRKTAPVVWMSPQKWSVNSIPAGVSLGVSKGVA